MGPRVIDVLRYSGPISLADLRDRVGGSLPELLSELKGLERDGLVDISGPRGNAEKAIVELSGKGLRSLMAW